MNSSSAPVASTAQITTQTRVNVSQNNSYFIRSACGSLLHLLLDLFLASVNALRAACVILVPVHNESHQSSNESSSDTVLWKLLETYLSTLITHRVMMEAVQHITSMPMKMLQNTSPKSHLPPVRSVTITNGMTTMATDRSATAKDTSR